MFLGLTGGFGCGKSSVLTFFETANWHVLSADIMCHDIYNHKDPEIFAELRKHWGKKVFNDNGVLNKSAISRIVFSDTNELKWLCSILYPKILQAAKTFLSQHRGENIIFEVPLLYEAKWGEMFDKIIAVYTTPQLQKERLLKTGFSEHNIDRRNELQLLPELKLELADYAIINNGNEKDLKKQCKELLHILQE